MKRLTPRGIDCPGSESAVRAAHERGSAMEHVGMDVHERESQIRILTEGGDLIERRIRTQGPRLVEVPGARVRARILIEAGTDGERMGRATSGAIGGTR